MSKQDIIDIVHKWLESDAIVIRNKSGKAIKNAYLDINLTKLTDKLRKKL